MEPKVIKKTKDQVTIEEIDQAKEKWMVNPKMVEEMERETSDLSVNTHQETIEVEMEKEVRKVKEAGEVDKEVKEPAKDKAKESKLTTKSHNIILAIDIINWWVTSR